MGESWLLKLETDTTTGHDGSDAGVPSSALSVMRPYVLPPLPPGCFYVEAEDPRQLGSGGTFILEDADPFDRYQYRAKAILCTRRTAFQDVTIADTYNYGLALFLDGAIQSADDDEALYHELLVQPAMLYHHDPRSVLIIGGGEGASLREVLAHRSVTRAVMVDLDPDVIEICREFLPTWQCGAFEDPRAELRFEDGRTFIEQSDELFDVVIIDVVDMLDGGPAQSLYTQQFYRAVRTRLRPGGILVVQGLEFTFNDYKGHTALRRTIATAFSEVHSYQVAVPSFLGVWGFILASDHLVPQDWQPSVIDGRIEDRLGPIWLDHLTGAFLQSTFQHCKETEFYLNLPGPILEDGVEFVPPPDIDEIEPTGSQLPAFQP